MGDVHGVFVADDAKVKATIESGKQVYFGEILGKHSEIYGILEDKDLTLLTDKPEEVEMVERLSLMSGYNPLDYVEEEEAESEEESE